MDLERQDRRSLMDLAWKIALCAAQSVSIFTRAMRIFRTRLWLSVKVDVHINNGGFVGRPHPSNGHAARSEIAREPPDHAYEQICVRQEEIGNVGSSSRKKPTDNVSDSR